MSMDEALVIKAMQENKPNDNVELSTSTSKEVAPAPESHHVHSIRQQLQQINLTLTATDESDILQETSVLEVVVPTKNATSSTSTTNSTKQSLDNILLIQSRLDGMKDSLFQVISSLENNPSLLSKWSRSFGTFSWFQKIGTGAVIPTLFIIGGLAASAPIAIIVGGGGSALLYSGAALLLDDLYNNTKGHTDKLRSGISGLIDLFGHILFSLEQLRHDLTEQVKLLTSENENLCKNVNNLHQEVGALTSQVENVSLEVENLQAANLEHGVQNTKLKSLVIELEQKNKTLDITLKGAAETTEHLGSMMANLASLQMKDTKDRDAFLNSLNKFSEDKIKNWNNVSKHMSKTQQELAKANSKLEVLGEKYESLNFKHEQLIKRFEKVMSHPAVQNLESSMAQQSSNARVMGQIGLMGSCAQELQSKKNSSLELPLEVPVVL